MRPEPVSPVNEPPVNESLAKNPVGARWSGIKNEVVYKTHDGLYHDLDVSRRYPDGTPFVTMPDDGGKPVFVMVRGNLETLMTTLFWVDACRYRFAKGLTLFLPFVPGQQQDRLINDGDYLFTAKSVADEINRRSFRRVDIIEPHSNVIPALIDNVFSMGAIFLPAEKKVYHGVIAPDAGAVRRAQYVADALDLPLYHGWKDRDSQDGSISNFGLEGLNAVLHGHYLVVDDICVGGGTFVGLGNSILNQGCTADLFVTHGLFTKGTDELFNYYQSIYTTDTILSFAAVTERFPLCREYLDEETRS